jgi:hypothetical protein
VVCKTTLRSVPQSTNLRIYESTNLRIYESTNLRIYESTNLRIYDMYFFQFTQETEAKFFEFLNQTSNSKGIEFEIRFGRFNFDPQTKRSQFHSNFDREAFYKLKTTFGQYNKTVTDTEEYIYPNANGKGVTKKIMNATSGDVGFMSKVPLKKYNVYDYDMRFSLAAERNLDPKVCEQKYRDNPDYEMKRTKHRTSYVLPFGSLDLTVVVSTKSATSATETTYEVELEITDGSSQQVPAIIQYITVILQIYQDNYYVISNGERRSVMNEYKGLTGAYYFIGAQPETLQKNMISALYNETYSVTDKADGERAFLFINGQGLVYFTDANMKKIYKTDLFNRNSKNCIVDGELVRTANKIHFYGFDVLYAESRDLRGDKNYTLKERLAIVERVVGSCVSKENSAQQYYHVSAKKFFFTNVFLAAEVILDSVNDKPYKNDGLIFTPVDEPYPTNKKWSKLLKWKPADLNTIDFYATRSDDANEKDMWYLHVQHLTRPEGAARLEKGVRGGNTTPALVLFDVEQLCGAKAPIGAMTFRTTITDNQIDPTTGEPYQSGTVIEFAWNDEANRFVPLRTRWDKTANPNKHGNFSSVACDVWNNIHNPVSAELLFRFTTPNSRQDVFFEKMRRFHNRVKEMLYNKYCKNTEHLLELCSGKGGDMHKWIYNRVKNVVGYDISEKNITECRRRIASTARNDNANTYTFHQLDLTSENAATTIQSANPHGFNNVNCHFGVHYFFKSQSAFNSLLDILDRSLHKGGLFITTFMDNTELERLMDDHPCVIGEKDNQIVYYLKKYNMSSPKFNNALRIILNGNNILGEGSDEYIINYSAFVEDMKSNGYELVESQLFRDLLPTGTDPNTKQLTGIEKTISFLNRTCVFKRSGGTETVLQTPKTEIYTQPQHDTKPYFDFKTIELKNKNDNRGLSVFKIATKYDVIDVMNCIEYKYYKHLIPDGAIMSFEDIAQTFTQVGIEYTPQFIESPFDIVYTTGDTNVYFTHYKHTIEKKSEDNKDNKDNNDNNDTLQYDNWYIVLNDEKLLFDPHAVKPQTVNETTSPTPVDTAEPLESKGAPVPTVKILKEQLKKAGLPVTGKKEELIARLNKHFAAQS